jgi:peptidoglycan/xylan/chitin deacetylase (PgdA/CDA1 family)
MLVTLLKPFSKLCLYVVVSSGFVPFMCAASTPPSGKNFLQSSTSSAEELRQFFLERLRYFEVSDELIFRFDQKLDSLFHQKVLDPNSEILPTLLEKEHFEMGLIRSLSEQSSEKMLVAYQMILRNAEDPKSPLHLDAKRSLLKFHAAIQSTLASPNRSAALAVIQELERMRPHLREELLKQAAFVSADSLVSRKLSSDEEAAKIFQSLESAWQEHQQQQSVEMISSWAPQMLDAPTLYPSVGSTGSISGSHLSAGVWALTFDDGPHPRYTQRLMDLLNAAKVPATFFWLSENLQRYPEIARTASERGFHRGSHSFTHKNLQVLKEPGLQHEIDDAYEVFTQVIGQKPTFFRCPYGNCGRPSSPIRQHIARLNMMSVLWNVDSLDWQDRNPQSIFMRVRKQMLLAGHGILLFHDIQPPTAAAVKLVIAFMQSHPTWKAYSLDEIMKLQTGAEYPSP